MVVVIAVFLYILLQGIVYDLVIVLSYCIVYLYEVVFSCKLTNRKFID